MNHLVIGLGEIGTAIQNILQCDGYDYIDKKMPDSEYDVIHICYPYFEDFRTETIFYKDCFKANLVIIHSTVPIGTTESLGDDYVVSPCRGVHPRLEEGIRTFVKYFGGKKAHEAAQIFGSLGMAIKTHATTDSRSIEALKLWDTTIYGWNIILEKEIHKFCKENNLDFDFVYTLANLSYNIGYRELKQNQYKKYILTHKDGPIGGHCIIPNCELLDSWVSDVIIEKNKTY
jgi:UDP-N-acetyl-D-mannosaminuronate dehydrogenase